MRGYLDTSCLATLTLLEDFALNLRLPDAIHVVMAARLDAVLISVDRNQCRAARSRGIRSINPLYDE